MSTQAKRETVRDGWQRQRGLVVGLLTRVRAAFCGRSVGFGRVALGAGGGRAAVCGDAASGLKGVLEAGMTMGGVSCRGG